MESCTKSCKKTSRVARRFIYKETKQTTPVLIRKVTGKKKIEAHFQQLTDPLKEKNNESRHLKRKIEELKRGANKL